MADDHRISFPVGDDVLSDFEDFVGIAHRSNDGDLVAHQIDEFDRHGLLVHRDDAKAGTPFGGGQCGVDHRGCSGGVKVDIGAGSAGKQGFALAVQFDEPLRDVLVGGVDHRIGPHLECFLQPCRNQIGDHDVVYTNGFERDGGAQTYRPGAEHKDLVRRFRLAPVDAVACHGHRLVEGGYFERNMVGHNLNARTANRVLDQQELRERTGGAAVSDNSAWRRHWIDDDVVADRDAGDLAADLDYLTRGFVAQWCLPLA